MAVIYIPLYYVFSASNVMWQNVVTFDMNLMKHRSLRKLYQYRSLPIWIVCSQQFPLLAAIESFKIPPPGHLPSWLVIRINMFFEKSRQPRANFPCVK